MQLLAVLAASVVVNAVVAIQPVVQELEKKNPHRHGRWWRWRHRNQDNGHGHSHGHGHGNGGEPITEVFTYDDPMSSSIATSTIVDPATFISTAYTYTAEGPLTSSFVIVSNSATSSYSYPNTTEAPLTTTLPASSSIMTSYTYLNTTHTYLYSNEASTIPSNSSSSSAISTSSSPACSITALTSTLTITESVTTTFTYTPTSFSNHTWITSISSSSQSAAPFPNITYSFNASQIFNFTTFKASPYYPSTALSTMLVSTTSNAISSSSSVPSSLSSSSSPIVETQPSSSTAFSLPTSLFISANPIYVAPTTAVLHPSTTASQTTTVVEGEATGVPDPAAFHCGVHGLPIGIYKMAEYWEERAGVDVTLEGCWKFCEAASEGCSSYSFYREEGLDDARCDLFGGSVADSLDSIIKEVPRVWYDIGCGNPLLLN